MIDDGRLEGKLAGIAMRFILNERPLSDKEKWIFEKDIYEPYLKRVCKITGEEIGPTDLEAHDEYGMSSETARSYVSFMYPS